LKQSHTFLFALLDIYLRTVGTGTEQLDVSPLDIFIPICIPLFLNLSLFAYNLPTLYKPIACADLTLLIVAGRQPHISAEMEYHLCSLAGIC
jgi:hypothetical protein